MFASSIGNAERPPKEDDFAGFFYIIRKSAEI